MRQNIEVRMSMQVQTTEDSRIIFNRDDAARKLTRAGQAFLQVGDNLIFEMFQVARADTPFTPEGAANLELLDEFSLNRILPDGRRQLLYRHHAPKPEAQKAANKVALSEAEVLVEHIRLYSEAHYGPPRIICLPRLPEAEERCRCLPCSGNSRYSADGQKMGRIRRISPRSTGSRFRWAFWIYPGSSCNGRFSST
ncbi:MAG: hypothetical protein M5U34_16775 [Chloroflexi bacterium]|nr:hypothetical protein [Chloroflexota bacterium]